MTAPQTGRRGRHPLPDLPADPALARSPGPACSPCWPSASSASSSAPRSAPSTRPPRSSTASAWSTATSPPAPASSTPSASRCSCRSTALVFAAAVARRPRRGRHPRLPVAAAGAAVAHRRRRRRRLVHRGVAASSSSRSPSPPPPPAAAPTWWSARSPSATVGARRLHRPLLRPRPASRSARWCGACSTSSSGRGSSPPPPTPPPGSPCAPTRGRCSRGIAECPAAGHGHRLAVPRGSCRWSSACVAARLRHLAAGPTRHRLTARSVRTLDREILRLAVPALAALAAEPLYVLADTAVVGHLGPDAARRARRRQQHPAGRLRRLHLPGLRHHRLGGPPARRRRRARGRPPGGAGHVAGRRVRRGRGALVDLRARRAAAHACSGPRARCASRRRSTCTSACSACPPCWSCWPAPATCGACRTPAPRCTSRSARRC